MVSADELYNGRKIGRGVSLPAGAYGVVTELARRERRPFSHVVTNLVIEALVERGQAKEAEVGSES